MKIKTDSYGQPLMVMRPTKKKKATKIAGKALRTGIFPSFEEMIEKCGPYTFKGYMTDKGDIVDENMRVVGRVEQGDSFITQKVPEKHETN